MGIPIAESVGALAAHTVHTHVKDERGVAPNYQFLIPGEGEFDYVAYLRAMREHGYTGFITAEISIMVQRRPATIRWLPPSRPTERSRAPLSRRGLHDEQATRWRDRLWQYLQQSHSRLPG